MLILGTWYLGLGVLIRVFGVRYAVWVRYAVYVLVTRPGMKSTTVQTFLPVAFPLPVRCNVAFSAFVGCTDGCLFTLVGL